MNEFPRTVKLRYVFSGEVTGRGDGVNSRVRDSDTLMTCFSLYLYPLNSKSFFSLLKSCFWPSDYHHCAMKTSYKYFSSKVKYGLHISLWLWLNKNYNFMIANPGIGEGNFYSITPFCQKYLTNSDDYVVIWM